MLSKLIDTNHKIIRNLLKYSYSYPFNSKKIFVKRYHEEYIPVLIILLIWNILKVFQVQKSFFSLINSKLIYCSVYVCSTLQIQVSFQNLVFLQKAMFVLPAIFLLLFLSKFLFLWGRPPWLKMDSVFSETSLNMVISY